MNADEKTHIAVGKIAQAHGMGGWLKVVPYSGIPQRFEVLRTLYVDTDYGFQGYIVEDVNVQQKDVLLKLRNVDSRDDAQKLGKHDLLVPTDQAIELPENSYFVHDLIGIKVQNEAGEEIGHVSEVLTNSGNDIYVVKKEQQEVLIPAVEAFIKSVDVLQGCMVVELIDGMLD
ncbi:MAG: ribosome maturation factor RimM [Calditrichota bacterium]